MTLSHLIFQCIVQIRLMNFFFNTYVCFLGGFQRQQQQPSPSGSDNSIQVVSLLISQKQLSPVIIDSTYSCQIEEKGVLLCRVFKQIFNSKTLCTSVRWFKCHFLAFHKPDTPHFYFFLLHLNLFCQAI